MIALRNIDLRFKDTPVLSLDQFDLKRGECVAVIGPSGAGKSSLGRYLAGRMGAGFHARASVSEKLPPENVVLVPQNVSEQLHSGLPLGRQFAFVADMLGKRNWRAEIFDAFSALNLPDPERLLAAYPGELSTGMCQRVLIAMVDFRAPTLVVADEISSALDEENAEHCVGWFLSRIRQRDAAAVVITHDAGLAQRHCDRTITVPRTAAATISSNTRPRHARRSEEPLLRGEHLGHHAGGRAIFRSLSIRIHRGELLGICGPSGIGKTSLLRMLAGLSTPREGQITRHIDLRRKGGTMMVFQSPEQILNPYLTVESLLTETLRYARPGAEPARWPDLCRDSLAECDLHPDVLTRRPTQLSGGQRQRVAIAKAMLARPGLVLCDEPSSQLDPANAKLIFQLLADRTARLGLACVVVSHDRESLRNYCDQILEMSPTGLHPLPDEAPVATRPLASACQ